MRKGSTKKLEKTETNNTGAALLWPAEPLGSTQVFWRVESSGLGTAGKEQGLAETTLEDAIFTYVQAIRALGRTQLNTVEIAEALSLRVAEVDAAVVRLRERGIRTVA